MGCSLRLWLDNEGVSVLLLLDFRLSYHGSYTILCCINAVKFVIEKKTIFPLQFTFFLPLPFIKCKFTYLITKTFHNEKDCINVGRPRFGFNGLRTD